MGILDEDDAERMIGILGHPGDDAAGSSQGRRGTRVAHGPAEGAGSSWGTRVARRPPDRGRGGRSREVKGKNREPNGPRGRKLAEIYWIRLDNGRELHGKLHITDALSVESEDQSFDIHFPDKSNLPLCSEGCKARLSGLCRSIIASDDLVAELDLWDDTSSLSEEGGKPMLICWTRYGFFSWDQLQTSSITTRFGRVTVKYVMMQNAAEGRLEIALSGAGEDPVKVYGTITAHCSNFDEAIHLFDRDVFEYVTLSPHHAIPLLRSVVNVPMDSTLTIEADIWDCNSNFARHNGIGQGTAQFEPDIFTSSSVMPIRGHSGEIAMRVHWL